MSNLRNFWLAYRWRIETLNSLKEKNFFFLKRNNNCPFLLLYIKFVTKSRVCFSEVSNLLVVTKERAITNQTPTQESQLSFIRILKEDIQQVCPPFPLSGTKVSVFAAVMFYRVLVFCQLKLLYWCCSFTKQSLFLLSANQDEHLGTGTKTNIYSGNLRAKNEEDEDVGYTSFQEVKVVLKVLGSGHRDISLVSVYHEKLKWENAKTRSNYRFNTKRIMDYSEQQKAQPWKVFMWVKGWHVKGLNTFHQFQPAFRLFTTPNTTQVATQHTASQPKNSSCLMITLKRRHFPRQLSVHLTDNKGLLHAPSHGCFSTNRLSLKPPAWWDKYLTNTLCCFMECVSTIRKVSGYIELCGEDFGVASPISDYLIFYSRYHGGGVCPTRTAGCIYEETAESQHTMEVPGGQTAGLSVELPGKTHVRSRIILLFHSI